MKTILTLCALAICGAFTLHAADAEKPKKPGDGKGGDKPKMSAEEMFKKLDANGDGKLTKEEYLANPRAKQDPAKGEERWKAISKGKDSITLEEFKAAGPGKGGDKGAPKKKPEAK